MVLGDQHVGGLGQSPGCPLAIATMPWRSRLCRPRPWIRFNKRPRADFVIVTLALVVEVKFLRKATQAARADVIEEVSADTGLYLNDETPFEKMVAFIWDDTASVHHHAELETGLTRLPGVVAAVVVSRPGSWTYDAADAKA